MIIKDYKVLFKYIQYSLINLLYISCTCSRRFLLRVEPEVLILKLENHN